MHLRKILSKHLLFAVSGLLLVAAIPPSGAGWLCFIALVPAFLKMIQEEGHTHPGLLVSGSIYGISVIWPAASLNGWWWVSAYAPAGYQGAFFGLLMLLIAVVFVGGTFLIFAFLYGRYAKHVPVPVIPAVASVVWAVLERGREFLMLNFGFSWGHLGYLLDGNPRLMQMADVGGVYIASAFLIFTNLSIAYAVTAWTGGARKRAVLTSAILAAVWVSAVFYGETRLNKYSDESGDDLRVSVFYTALTTDEVSSLDSYRNSLEQAEKGLKEGAGLVVMPENIFPFFVFDETTGFPLGYDKSNLDIKSLYDELTELSGRYPDALIVAGMHSVLAGKRYNSAVAWKSGKAEVVYRKNNLLPLAEKIPVSFEENHIHPLSSGDGDSALFLAGRRVGILICSEIMTPHPSLEYGLMLNIGNDNIFDNPRVGEYNYALARFRAIENRAYLIRSLKGGISGIISPAGTIISEGRSGSGIISKNIRVL